MMGRFIDVKLKPGHIPKGRLAFTLIVFCLLAVSLIRFYGDTEEVREVQYELHSVAFDQVNIARLANNVSLLDYDTGLGAQEHAWRMMDRGEAYLNLDLSAGVVECVEVYTEKGLEPEVAIALMVHSMVYDDDFGGDRVRVLDPGHEVVCVGVAVDGDSVFLVLDFS